MFEEKTFKSILDDMLAMAPDGIDTSCGSVYYDAVAPVALELSKLYEGYARIIREAFPDTAEEKYLLRHAEELGIKRSPATSAVLLGRFNAPIPEGTKFVLGQCTYTSGEFVMSQYNNYYYKMTCDFPGADHNSVTSGVFVPISYIEGLTYARATELLSAGVDEESLESLRVRVCAAASDGAYGGNIADYRKRIMTGFSVGGVKIYPAWAGGGTVRAVIQGADGGVPDASLLAEIKNTLDPIEGSGEGLGTAPIGHSVTVEGASSYSVKIETVPTYADGWNAESARSYIEAAVKKYISETAELWQSSNALTLRISQIDSAIIGTGCVIDLTGTKLYSVSDSAYLSENITLGADVVPVFGEVVLK